MATVTTRKKAQERTRQRGLVAAAKVFARRGCLPGAGAGAGDRRLAQRTCVRARCRSEGVARRGLRRVRHRGPGLRNRDSVLIGRPRFFTVRKARSSHVTLRAALVTAPTPCLGVRAPAEPESVSP